MHARERDFLMCVYSLIECVLIKTKVNFKFSRAALVALLIRVRYYACVCRHIGPALIAHLVAAVLFVRLHQSGPGHLVCFASSRRAAASQATTAVRGLIN
jgi:hypothetical protein